MHALAVVIFDTTTQAGIVRKEYLEKCTEFFDNFNKAVVVIRNIDGSIELHYVHRFAADGAALGGFWGGVIGLLFLNPVLGALTGATFGGVIGEIGDLGIEKHFIEELSRCLQPGSSALFVPGTTTEIDSIFMLLKDSGGSVVKTRVTIEDKKKLLKKLKTLYAESIEKST